MEDKHDILVEHTNQETNRPIYQKKSSDKSKWAIAGFLLILISVVVATIILIPKDKVKQLQENNNESDIERKDNYLYKRVFEPEDLNFTEEEHRNLSRSFAAQGMVLATNFGELPLLPTDRVVLFGNGTNATVYGGWGSVNNNINIILGRSIRKRISMGNYSSSGAYWN